MQKRYTNNFEETSTNITNKAYSGLLLSSRLTLPLLLRLSRPRLRLCRRRGASGVSLFFLETRSRPRRSPRSSSSFSFSFFSSGLSALSFSSFFSLRSRFRSFSFPFSLSLSFRREVRSGVLVSAGLCGVLLSGLPSQTERPGRL